MEPFALLDDATARPGAPTSRLCTGLLGEHRCDDPVDLDAICAAVEADVAAGAHAVVLADYEWGVRLAGADGGEPVRQRPGSLRFLMFERQQRLAPSQVEAWLAQQDGGSATASPAGFADLAASVTRDAFDDAIAAIHRCIGDGETYQVNYTYRLAGDVFGSPVALYRRLRARQPVAYGALIALPGDRFVLSCSPELFLRHGRGRLTARPMKGTARREPMPEGDSERARWLAHDAKNRAENLMIVDLLRNDVGRIAATGSVHVPQLFALEPYRTVLQMTSTVEADLPSERRFGEVLRALFPCGSITGAPKHHTMELIGRLESTPRGLYTGSIGWLDAPVEGRACGDFCFSVAIRTLELGPARDDARRDARLGIGAGIVIDSVAADEWDECRLKARFATGLDPGITLIETMRADGGGGIPLLEAHLERLSSSASALGFALDVEAIRERVLTATRALAGATPHRVRLELRHDGGVDVQLQPLQALPDGAVDLLVASQPLPTDERALVGHKTSRRATYDAAIREAAARGAFDVLFLDRRGGVTEGARTSVFARLDGRWWTPPLAAGVLPGVMRARVLADPAWHAGERRLTLDDLRRAEALMVCNALRGALPARLRETPT